MKIESRLITFEDWTLRFHPADHHSARVLLMLHGWTGDEDSMWVFVRNLRSKYWMLAPRAPYSAPLSGYSWRQDISTPHTLDDFKASAQSLCDLVDRWSVSAAVDASMIDIVGFSQGAAMAYIFAMLYPERVHKLAGLAGFIPRETKKLINTQPLKGKSVFVAHGTQDTLITIDRARQSVDFLKRAGAQVNFCEADVGHKVSAECLKALDVYFTD